MTNEERFTASFIKTDFCWIWRKAQDKDGYGPFSWKFRFGRGGTIMRRATRVAYELFIGPIPEKLMVCHQCDNPSCVNPNHLFLGTSSDNLLDASNKGRINGGRAARRRHANQTTIDMIRSLYSSGKFLQIELAEQFDLSSGYVSKLLRWENWKIENKKRVSDSAAKTRIIFAGMDKWQKRTAVLRNRR